MCNNSDAPRDTKRSKLETDKSHTVFFICEIGFLKSDSNELTKQKLTHRF